MNAKDTIDNRSIKNMDGLGMLDHTVPDYLRPRSQGVVMTFQVIKAAVTLFVTLYQAPHHTR
jgi:hypothetical protein